MFRLHLIEERRMTDFYYILSGILIVLFSVQGCHAECQSRKLYARSGMIRSPTYQSTPASCIFWYINTPLNAVVTISFDFIKLATSSPSRCEANFVQVGPVPEHFFCGYERHTYIAVVKKDHVWIKYNTFNYSANTFQLKYIVAEVPSLSPCLGGETACDNGKCILYEWLCNGLNECGDNSDEVCPSVDVTTTTRRSTPDQYIWGSCGSHEMVCKSASTGKVICLDAYYQCNGHHDCLYGVDELPSRCGKKNEGSEICSDTLSGWFGHFTSPLYPHRYPNNEDCDWVIHVGAPTDKVQLRFTDFALQSEKYTDIVEVYDGKDMGSSLIGTYYGSNIPPTVIESTSNWMYVRFHSNSISSERGFNATYQVKGSCIPGVQISCQDEYDCYNQNERCDGFWNCPLHGFDEQGCFGCPAAMFSCGSRKCYSQKERCNGKSHCFSNADENNCTSKVCNSNNGLFLCKNNMCIYEKWQCDHTDDCGDNSDEEGCSSPFFTRRVIVAAVTGSLICSLLLVIALGCICKVYALRVNEQSGPRHESPLSRLQAEFMRRRAPPPPYHEAMLTSRPYEEVRQDYLRQARDQRRRRASERRRNRPLPPTPEEPSTYQMMNESGGDLELGGDNDVQLLSLDSTHIQNANADSSSTTELIPPTNSSESDESPIEDGNDVDDDDDDSVLLDLSDGVVGSATWRSRASDDERSPEHVPSEAGGDSIDSASASLSVDNIALHETLDKDNGVEADSTSPVSGVLDINKESRGEQSNSQEESSNLQTQNNDLNQSVEEPVKAQ